MSKQQFLKILKYLKIALLFPFGFLLLVHFVIKDRNEFFAKLFNVSPIPILIGVALILLLLFIPHRKWFKGVLIVTVLLIGHWFYSYYGFKTAHVSQENKHILLWNIDYSPTLPEEQMQDIITTYNPEIMVFLESWKIEMSELKRIKTQFPQYKFNVMQGYFLLATKEDVELIEYNKYKSITKHHLIKTKVDGQLMTLLLTDIAVFEKHNRWQDLKPVLEYSLENEADIIIGDFNTPYESMHFDGYKEHYKSFHNLTEGFAATWPKGLPLLELDQIWVNSKIEPISLKKFYYEEFSNHDMLIGSFKTSN